MSESPIGQDRSTAFTRLVGCRLPIQQAAMGGVVDPRLAGAVALAGGLGMLSGTMVPSDDLTAQIDEATRLGGPDGRIGVGFLMPFLDRDVVATAANACAVIECFYGDPDRALVEAIHQGGALATWQVGSLDEAVAALDAECDILVVQGVEAGGHIHGDHPLDALLADVRGRTEVPLVAAGGIGTGERAAELLAQGADGVRIGTRFLAAEEADVHPDYVAALIDAHADDTVITETFAMAWPDAPHRVLRSCVEASDAPPDQRFPLPPGRDFPGDVASAALYAGRSVDAVTGVTTAAAIVAEFAAALAST